MKRILTLIVIACICSGLLAQEEKIKTGWNVGPIPAVSFNTDLGFQYGALVNLFHYGDGSNYPAYNHSILMEVSAYTKGNKTFRFMYDSDKLIPGIKLTTDISYLTSDAYDFLGFNGYDAVYNAAWQDDEMADYRTRMFYKLQRKLFRFKNDFKGKLAGDNLFWSGGLSIKSFNLESVDVEKFNEGKDPADQLPDPGVEPGLYEKYQQWGILNSDESDGGLITTLKAGLTYDSRDNTANAMKGIWFETGIEVSPSFLSENSFTRLYAIHRQYFTIIPRDLNFAYRIGYQTTLGGDVPFYYQNQLITSQLTGTNNEGLGGDKSLRGMVQNRIVGNGVLYGNFELRWKFVHFNLLNQNFHLALVGFMDAGMVTDKVDFTIPGTIPGGEAVSDYFITDVEKMHYGVGGGLRVVMNENFIIKVDFGKALDEQDGDTGLYIGINYLF